MNGHWGGGVFISKMQNTIKSLKFLFSFTFSKVILWTRLESFRPLCLMFETPALLHVFLYSYRPQL